MHVLFRVDSSNIIGSGHVVRCLNLANELKARGASIHFVCRDHIGNVNKLIVQHNYQLTLLPNIKFYNSTNADTINPWIGLNWEIDADETILLIKKNKPNWLIVDHYGIDTNWEKKLRPYVDNIFVIDDLVDREHNCDILLDQNLHNNTKERYKMLVPDNAKLFLGPHYAILKSDFSRNTNTRIRNGIIKNILVYYGSIDICQHIFTLLDALNNIGNNEIVVKIILGNMNDNCTAFDQLSRYSFNIEIINVSNRISEMMNDADIAIGACGISQWERCCMGLPSIVVVTADNQKEDAEILSRLGAVINMGDIDNITTSNYEDSLVKLFLLPDEVKKMGNLSYPIMEKRELSTNKISDAIFNKQ